ncbi:MAG: 3-oxoacyl-ACP reductase FabG [Pseudomonadota bacterium]
MSLENKVALVTGATRGIGRAIAEALLKLGATVVGTATSEEGAQRITEYIQAAGGKGQGYCLNVTDAANVEQVLGSIQENFGTPLILVNNAGITRDNLMLRMKDEEWDQVLETNLTSVYRMSKAVLRGMTKVRWGRIINISSVVGSMGNAGQANYSAAKAGMEGFSRSLAREIGSRGITVNAVAPGFIDTDMTRDLPEAHKQALLAQIPAGRLGLPQEIADAVCFLAREESGYITGATIPVNGGMYM